jgi:hypothetical protein
MHDPKDLRRGALVTTKLGLTDLWQQPDAEAGKCKGSSEFLSISMGFRPLMRS